MSRVEGVEQLNKNIQALSDRYGKKLADAIKQGTLMVHGTAVKSIQERSPGQTVIRYTANRNAYPHTAAAPGYAPNTDTGRLVSSIKFVFSQTNGEVSTNLQYGKYLEFGTSRMAARPWLIPALEKNKGDIINLIKKAVS